MPWDTEGQVRADLVRISAPALRPQAVATHTPLHSLNLQMQSEYLPRRTKESPGAHKGWLKEGVICRDDLPGFPETHMGLPGPAPQAYRAPRGPAGVCVSVRWRSAPVALPVACVYVHVYVRARVCTCVHVCARVYMCAYMRVYVCVRVCTCVHVCLRVCVRARVCVRTPGMLQPLF